MQEVFAFILFWDERVSRRRKKGLSYQTLCIKRQEAGNIVGKESNCEKKTGKSANWFSMTYLLKY